jgi:hypothetical protein
LRELLLRLALVDAISRNGADERAARGVIFQVLSPTLFHVNSPRRASLPSVFSTSLSS